MIFNLTKLIIYAKAKTTILLFLIPMEGSMGIIHWQLLSDARLKCYTQTLPIHHCINIIIALELGRAVTLAKTSLTIFHL